MRTQAWRSSSGCSNRRSTTCRWRASRSRTL